MSRTVAVMLVVALALALAGASLGAAGCGSGTHFAKTRFVLHAGLAFGAFHHFIYEPFKQGRFHKGAPKRGRTIAKALAAAAFTYHEVKVARRFAQHSAILRRVFSPLGALAASVAALPAVLRGGGGSGLINRVQRQIGRVSGQSSQAGQPIKERVPALP